MWVLIISVVVGSYTGVSVTTQEFTSKERCMTAAHMALNQKMAGSHNSNRLTAICIPK